MGYDQYTIPNDCSCRTFFCCFPLAFANICPWPLVPFFQISLENRADKTTHNTFQDCRVHFFRQLFLKQLYIRLNFTQSLTVFVSPQGAHTICLCITLILLVNVLATLRLHGRLGGDHPKQSHNALDIHLDPVSHTTSKWPIRFTICFI